MSNSSGSRIPQSGEQLILGDNRRFVLRQLSAATRGWWFRAESQDGRSTLQGNVVVAWDERAGAWRPVSHALASVPRHSDPTFAAGPAPLHLVRDRAKQG